MKKITTNKLCPILSAKIMTQSMDPVPVIVQLSDQIQNINTHVSGLSAEIKSNLPLINGFSGLMTTEAIYKLSNNPDINYISFDTKIYTLLDIAVPSIAANFAHDKGYYGDGITIAIIDTGASLHDDLVTPNNRIIGFKDFVNNKTTSYDDNGHGTHVAGIIAGNGYSSKGKYTGVAPRANILVVKALDENGGGSSSGLIQAISYIIETKDLYHTKIINLSLGTPSNTPCEKDPLCKAVEKAVLAGLTVIVAAGNSGPSEGTILSPGISNKVITVGAVDDKKSIDPRDDTLAEFSSRGPTSDGLLKPDILAPGVNIESLSNSNKSNYVSLSGTSMATPMVSGCVALLLNKYGNITPSEIKEKLIGSCFPLNDPIVNQGAGIVNLKSLFEDKPEKVTENRKSDGFFGGDMMETVIMALVLLFILDSRI